MNRIKMWVLILCGVLVTGLTPTVAAAVQSDPYVLAAWEMPGGPSSPFDPDQILAGSLVTNSKNLNQLDGIFKAGYCYQVDLYANDAKTATLIASGVLPINDGRESWPNGTYKSSYSKVVCLDAPTKEPLVTVEDYFDLPTCATPVMLVGSVTTTTTYTWNSGTKSFDEAVTVVDGRVEKSLTAAEIEACTPVVVPPVEPPVVVVPPVEPPVVVVPPVVLPPGIAPLPPSTPEHKVYDPYVDQPAGELG